MVSTRDAPEGSVDTRHEPLSASVTKGLYTAFNCPQLRGHR